MALAQEKRGGPYSKDEREKRQKEVFRLHFEFGYPATKIADLMKINRNTINEDIKYWYSNIKEEIKQDSEDFILRQIGRLEAQRSRVIENITENKIDDVRYEKLLLDIDAKINSMLLRINSGAATSESTEIKEDVIKDIVLFLIIKHSEDYSLKKEEIISEIINMQQCTIAVANEIFSKIEILGLECCRKFRSHEFVYDLLEFAYLRRYVQADDKFVVIVNSLYILHTHMRAEKIRLNKKYTEKHGDKEKWTDKTFEKYDEEKKTEMKRYAEATSKM
ncbi:MAG: hypothetical protein COW27_03490, partial [Nitrosopumilales archaeon CG15_BIG_FIL_POST_REV_8_21_14_020_37_12]